MPHTLAPHEPTLLDDFIRDVEAKNLLTDRIARYTKLLAKHGISADEFVDGLAATERELFDTASPREAFALTHRWLSRCQDPSQFLPPRRINFVQTAWAARYRRAHAVAPTDRHTLALRLRTIFTVQEGIIRWEPYDVPWAPEEDFLDWLSPEAYEWAAILGQEIFRGVIRSWLEEYFCRVGLPRLSGRPVFPMQPREHQASFISSEHFDLHLRRLAKEECVAWTVPIPPHRPMTLTITSGGVT